MKGFYRKLVKGFYSLTHVSSLLTQAALVFMSVSICYDVFMRFVVRDPTMWVLEVNTFLVIAVCFLPAADLLKSDSQLRVTFFYEKMSPGVQRKLSYLNALVGMCVTSVIAWKGFEMVYSAYVYDERMSTPLGTPYCIPYSLLPIGFGLLFIGYLLGAVGLLLGENAPAETDSATSVV